MDFMGSRNTGQGHRRPPELSVTQLIDGLLDQSALLQIATSAAGAPWICTVCFARDESYNLYWFSRHSTRHSQEIALNPQVAGTVAPPFAIGDKSRGLQLFGVAGEVREEPDLSTGLAAMQRRYDFTDERFEQLRTEVAHGSADYGLYRFQPDQIILYDTVNFPESPRQTLDLKSPPNSL